jgi:hypothetical protein
VPAWVKVKLKVAPLARVLLANKPVWEVTVWLTESWFVQVTVVPTVTVSVAGEKAKSLIVTAAAPGV